MTGSGTAPQQLWSRRGLLASAGAATIAIATGGAAAGSTTVGAAPWHEPALSAKPPTPDEALRLLQEGNRRWVSGQLIHPNLTMKRRREVAAGQNPFAVVLGCIDSRVPPEFVFDRGLGDLFVVRDAAAAPDDFVEGSLEYGPAHSHTPLVVVLGHQKCGAVTAGVEALQKGETLDGHLAEVGEAIKPAWEAVKDQSDETTVVDNTTREMIRMTARHLSQNSTIKPYIDKGKVAVRGAYYSLDTGEVSWEV